MITEMPLIKRRFARPPVTRSIFSAAAEYLRSELGKKRCVRCRWTGSQKCSSCMGKGMIVGEGWFIPGLTPVCLEPCRHCIGTGQEPCECCSQRESDDPISTPHY